MALYHSPRIVTDGLVLYVDAANTKSYPGSGTTWSDLSGQNRNGSLVNGATFNSANNGSMLFDGINDRIEVPSSTYTFTGGTLEAWIKLNAINRDQGFVGINSGGYVNFWMPGNANQMRWEVIGTTANPYTVIYTTTVFTTGIWYCVTGTFNGTSTTVFVNGVQESTQSMTNQPTSITTVAYIGDYNAGGYPSSSNISIVKLYNRPLSNSEILRNFQATRGRFGI